MSEADNETKADFFDLLQDEDMQRLFAFQKIENCSASFDRFLSDHERTIGAYFFLAFLAARLDSVRDVAADALQHITERKASERKPSDVASLSMAMTHYSETNSSC